jgi:O-antigen/teichoic acid export membrane protein
MNTIQTIAKNSGVLAVAHAITMILSLVLVIFIARSIGDVDFGKLGFAQSFTGILVIFADMGLSTVTIREITRQKELTSKYLSNIFLIKLILSVVTFALIALIINLMHYPADTIMVVYLIGISSILSSLSALSRSIFRAFEKMEFEAFLNISKSIVTTGIGLAVLFSGYGLIAIASVYLVAGIVDLLATLVITAKKFAKPKLEVDFSFWKQIIRLALPFSFQIDIVMLSVMKGDSPVGWYKAACVLVYSLVIIPDLLSYSIFPVMSRFYISSRDALKKTLEKSAKYLFIIGLPTAIGTILLADRIILLFYGEEFSHSIIALQILSLYLPLRFINHATGYTLSSINKEPLRALSATIAATTNVVLNLFLIPKFSFAGAAIATAITEVALFISYYYFVAKHFHKLELRPIFIKPCLACLAMGIFVFYLKDINLALLVVSAAIIYLAVFYFIKGFDEEDKAIFRNLKEGKAVGRNKVEDK